MILKLAWEDHHHPGQGIIRRSEAIFHQQERQGEPRGRGKELSGANWFDAGNTFQHNVIFPRTYTIIYHYGGTWGTDIFIDTLSHSLSLCTTDWSTYNSRYQIRGVADASFFML